MIKNLRSFVPTALDAAMPGVIVRDFEVFLQSIPPSGFLLAGKKGLLPDYCLPALNAKMSHPLRLALQRHQQFCYPHISAMYWLARALGLIQIKPEKSKRYLVVDEDRRQAWQLCNEVEKYFNLMHTWLFHCDPALIDRHHSRFSSILGSVINFFKHKLKNRVCVINDPAKDSWVLYDLKLYNLALLELFGMVTVGDANLSDSKSWLISRITETPFGEFWVKEVSRDENFTMEIIMDSPAASKKFHSMFQAFFPAWEKKLEPPVKSTDPAMHFFKISSEKTVWRRLAIAGTETLECLADCILEAYNFDHDHLYQFSYTDCYGISRIIHHPQMDEDVFADEICVGDLDLPAGETLEFLYDFGDSWKFTVRFEKIDPTVEVSKPILIGQQGKAPAQYSDFD